MEQAHPQDTTGLPLKELRFNAHDFLLKDALMLMHAQGAKKVFQEKFESQNAYLFSQEHLKLDTSDVVYSNEAEGYSLNASLFSRYEMTVSDVSKRGLKKFLLGPELTLRHGVGSGGPSHNIDMEIILDQQDIDRLLAPPLYGATNHLLPMDNETIAMVHRQNQRLDAMIEAGQLPVTYEVDSIVQNDDDMALNRLRRVLKSGAYVSQLAAVSNKISKVPAASPRLAPIFRRVPIRRPYENVTDIDAYLDRTLGPSGADGATVVDLRLVGEELRHIS